MKKILMIFIGMIALLLITAFYWVSSRTGYAVEDGKVVYKYINGSDFKTITRKLPDADPATFESLGFGKVYGKDQQQVYLEGLLIKGADPTTFEILDGLYKYTRDKDQLFYRTKKISDHPDHFELLAKGYARDHQYAFKQGHQIEGADGPSFELMDEKGMLAKDRRHIYYFGQRIEGSHSPTFHHLAHHYYADQAQVYHRSSPIPGVSPNDFEVLGERYARSQTQVFYEAKAIENADPESFILVADEYRRFYAKDKHRNYSFGKPTTTLAQ